MGWDTNLDPERLPKMQDHGFNPPALSMDEYVRFCARMRLEMSEDSLRRLNSLEEDLPVKVPFKIQGASPKTRP